MDISRLPTFKDVSWRWLTYLGSATLLGAIVFACVHEVELKRDAPCEIVSLSEFKLRGYDGLVAAVFVQPGERVASGMPLFNLTSDVIPPDGANADGRPDAGRTIVAPRTGVVVASGLLQGRRLDPAEVVMVIDTDSQRHLVAVLQVPSRQRGFVSVGQTVRIKLDAMPYTRFGTYEARIVSVSATAQRGSDPSGRTAGTTHDAGDYLAWAMLPDKRLPHAGPPPQILPGMRGRASIVVERTTIAGWVLAPLLRRLRG
ncbi:HlyD family efflux transporter periplasmic adaptor subunit [Dyella halodurans]|uniref:HlyD family efflux transporter periplasmic adaptor subunit n=1 Tax=Dyella halodurans TaxID=1920171 RepID=A0ABV9C7B0_9GAMM|nr:HlyD family efflux transporter periplasmic adaptor subunit [Dyella halodurans]